jgi:hypothetical protein
VQLDVSAAAALLHPLFSEIPEAHQQDLFPQLILLEADPNRRRNLVGSLLDGLASKTKAEAECTSFGEMVAEGFNQLSSGSAHASIAFVAKLKRGVDTVRQLEPNWRPKELVRRMHPLATAKHATPCDCEACNPLATAKHAPPLRLRSMHPPCDCEACNPLATAKHATPLRLRSMPPLRLRSMHPPCDCEACTPLRLRSMPRL